MKLTFGRYGLAVLVLAFLFTLAVPAQPNVAPAPFKVTTVILVRHAEKQATPPGNPPEGPPLTNEGKVRAKNLARMLGKAGVKAIITSQYLRTRETAQPLADVIGIAPVAVKLDPDPANSNRISEQSIKKIVEQIQQHAGETVLVVGHTNSLPQLIGKLGGPSISDIPESDFDNLFILTIYAKDKAKLVQLKY